MPNGDPNYQLGVLESRVGNIEAAIKSIEVRFGDQMDSLVRKLDSRSQTQWGTILTFLALLVGCIGAGMTFVINPLKEADAAAAASAQHERTAMAARLDKLVEGIAANRDRDREVFSTKEDIESRLRVSGARRDDQFAGVTTTLGKLDDRLVKLNDSMVPRGEHEEKWRSSEQRFADQQRQIDSVAKAYSDLVSAPMFLKSLDERMRQIETRLPR